jgi:alanine racemase
MRSTRVEIDLGAVSHNLKQIRRFTGTSIMMAIKANAYGHGAHEVGRLVEREHLVDMLGVTSIEEGIDLRDAGVTLPVLIFTLVDNTKEDVDALFEYRLTPTITDNYHFEAMIDGARRWGRPIDVHLKTDTGMGRLGLPPEEALDVLNSLSGINEIKVSGIYTHFPVSDSPDKEFTKEQIFIFQQIIDKARFLGKDIKYMHCANSGAIVDHPDSYMNMVRPGLLCYGLYPSPESTRKLDVIPAMTMKSSIIFIKRVRKGTGLSYGLTYQTCRDTYIGTVPVGYADGYMRSLSNNTFCIIDGKKYPVVGRICMDQCLVELGDDIYPVGQEVILFGKEIITVEDIALWAGTIPYEVICNMNRRVPRTYVIEDEPCDI